MRIGTPLSPSATKVMMLGSGELGKEVVIELQRLGVEVIAVDLHVPDRIAERRPAGMPHGQQRDFEIELDLGLDDHAGLAYAPRRHRILPSLRDLIAILDLRLPLAR